MKQKIFWRCLAVCAAAVLLMFAAAVTVAVIYGDPARRPDAITILSLAAAVLLMGAVVFSVRLSADMTAQVRGIGESLKSLNEGSYVPLKTDMSEPELYTILTETDSLFQKTKEHILSIEREQERLDFVLNHVAQSIFAVTATQTIAFLNAAAEGLFHSGQHAVGKTLPYMVADVKLCRRMKEALADGKSTRFEQEMGTKTIIVDMRSVAAADKRLGITYVVIVTDISAERLMMRQKSDFFANASHELKTPLTSMQGMSELLKEDSSLTDRARGYAERLNTECERLNTLILDMLKLSNLDSLRADAEKEAVDLAALAREIGAELGVEAQRRNVSITIEGEATVTAEPKRMYELVSNLMTNAVRYNIDGGKVTVSLTEIDKSAQLVVKDTGIGIATEHLPRLCERFYRVDKSRSKKTGGTGLGLAIVKHICSLVGATLSFDSQLGNGTAVTVRFVSAKTNDDTTETAAGNARR